MGAPPSVPIYADSLFIFLGDLRSRLFSSQVKAARHFGLAHTTISRYENDILVPPLGYLASLGQLLVDKLAQEGRPPAEAQQALLPQLNKALRYHYPDEKPFRDWAEVRAIAADYLARQRSARQPASQSAQPTPLQTPEVHRESWGQAPDVAVFYGREAELAQLDRWLTTDRCRLVGVLGMGGLGKTSVVTRLTHHSKDQFDAIIWRSLRNAPPVEETVNDCLQFLSDASLPDPSPRLDHCLLQLAKQLRRRRCLWVLDNFESVLRSSDRAGHYRQGYEGYGQLLRLVGEADHQSCLLITTREKPKELAYLAGADSPARILSLAGLGLAEGQAILQDRGLFGAAASWAALVEQYSGNPMALKLAAETIRELFDGDIATFLAEGVPIFGGVRDLLDQQFERLMPVEQETITWLAVEREAVTVTALRQNFVYPPSKQELLAALRGLLRRSLLEKNVSGFTLQNVVMEYIANRLVNQACDEVAQEKISILNRHALVKAEAKDYVRESQIRLLLEPVGARLRARLGEAGLEAKLVNIIAKLRRAGPRQPGYAGGNVFNLLARLKDDLSGTDFSDITVRQAYLQGLTLHNVNFAGADLAHSVFTEIFDTILTVAFSPDGRLLAGGTANGQIRLWPTGDRKQRLSYSGHTDWVRSVTFSPDGQLLASGSSDQTVRVWEAATGRCRHVLQGHTGQVMSVAFSPDGRTLASSSDDRTIRLWDAAGGQCLRTLQIQTGWVGAAVFSPDGRTLASGGDDQTIRLWEVETGRCFQTLTGHTGWVWTVAFSPDGRLLASGGDDHTVKLWAVDTDRPACLRTLAGHTDRVWSVAFSPTGRLLASGSDDQTIKLWVVDTGRPLNALTGHTGRIWSVAFNADGRTLASGSDDQTIKLWDTQPGRCFKSLQGYTNWVGSLAFNPEGTLLAGGSDDQILRLWDVSTGVCRRTLHGHANWVWSVAFSPDGRLLASGGDDHLIWLWPLASDEPPARLSGHTDWVRSIAFSPDGRLLASGSEDRTIRLWDVAGRESRQILRGHTHRVRSIAFSPDGRLLASGSEDRTIRLWDVAGGRCIRVLEGHTNQVKAVAFHPAGQILASGSDDETVCLWDVAGGESRLVLAGHTNAVWSVAFSPDGRLLASGGCDQTVRLWDMAAALAPEADPQADYCRQILSGHREWIRAVQFSPDGRLLASGSHDETIKLWQVQTGVCRRTLRGDRPYEGMNIEGAVGLSEAERTMLTALGAVEASRERRSGEAEGQSV